jgi:TRAP-type C4-dicarboxylate transport system substrate-binding protein
MLRRDGKEFSVVGRALFAAATAVLLGLGPCAPVASQVLKIGTIAPPGTPWEEALLELAARWYEISSGSVRIRVYAGSVASSEDDLVRKIRLGQLQGAALTQLSLGRMVPEVYALATPFLIETDEEFAFVMEQTEDYFRGLFRAEGFEMLNWSTAGWVHFFGSEPLRNPRDLRRMKIAVPAGDEDLLQLWRGLGFTAFSLAIPDFAIGLQTGMVDAFFAPPLAVVAYQWFGLADHMSSVPVTPVLGGVVLDADTWERIPADLRPALRRAAARVGRTLTERTQRLDAEAVAGMDAYGVSVDRADAEDEAAWRDLAAQGVRFAVGRMFGQDAVDLVRETLRRFRAETSG